MGEEYLEEEIGKEEDIGKESKRREGIEQKIDGKGRTEEEKNRRV